LSSVGLYGALLLGGLRAYVRLRPGLVAGERHFGSGD